MNPYSVFQKDDCFTRKACQFIVRHIGRTDNIMIIEEISEQGLNPYSLFKQGDLLTVKSCKFTVQHVGHKDNVMILEEISDENRKVEKDNMTTKATALSFAVLLFLSLASTASASTFATILPWEKPLVQIAQSLQGPVAAAIAVIALVGAAISLMLFETSKGLRWFVGIVIGFSIVSGAFGLMGLFGLTTALI